MVILKEQRPEFERDVLGLFVRKWGLVWEAHEFLGSLLEDEKPQRRGFMKNRLLGEHGEQH